MSRYPLINIEELLEISLDDLLLIWDDLPEIFQSSLIKHPQAPSLLIWHAVCTNPSWALDAVWGREKIPKDLVWNLFLCRAWEHGPAHEGIVRHLSVGEEFLIVLTELGGINERWELLYHRNATGEVLERMTHDPHIEIRKNAVKRLRAWKESESTTKKSKGSV